MAVGAIFLAIQSAHAVASFSVPGFVDEEVYAGNGMITVRFDAAGRLWVIEKQGRVLVFQPNSSTNSTYTYEYFEKPAAAPSWTVIPNFADTAQVTFVKSGTINSFSLAPKQTNDNFAFRYTGSLSVPSAGTYMFFLVSDDGSRLYIDNSLVVNHDGTHGSTEKSNSVSLASGAHDIRVEFFEAGGGESLTVQYEGPGIPKSPVTTGPFKAPSVFADLRAQVSTDGETGMTGFALDPDFANTRYLYVLYATPTGQRISRLASDTNFTAMVPGSETILLSGLPNLNTVHKAGDMAFHPEDPNNLYVMLGDDGNRTLVGFLTNYNGKILKISASDGLGLPTNPYYDGTVTSVASRIWSARYRNPFRFEFDPATPVDDVLYISENGDAQDRIVRIAKGADGGWDNQFFTNSVDGKRKVLDASDPSKTGIVIVRGGPFAPGGSPVLYDARYGGGERNEVRRWTLSGTNYDQLVAIPADAGDAFYEGYEDHGIVDFELGPDGAIYYTDSAQGPSLGTGYRIGRIRFVGGIDPIAAFTAAPATGAAPFQVTFTDASTAPSSSIASWSWEFGDGQVSAQPNPVHTYTNPGVYTVRLTVVNSLGLTDTKEESVTGFHQITVGLKGQVIDGRNLPGTNIAASTELRVYQNDGLTPVSFSGGIGVDGNTFTVPAGGAINASISVRITGAGLVLTAGEGPGDGVEAAFVGVPLSQTRTSQNAIVTFRLSDTMLRGRAMDTRGEPARVDVGLSRVTPSNYFAFVGGRDFLPGRAASGIPHRTVPDALGYYHAPISTGGGNATFHMDTSADTLAATHGRVATNVQVYAGTTTVHNLIIGLYDGGIGESNLTAIAETPNVDFTNRIQAIFSSACAACHNDIASNSKGLDLQAGAAFAELVGQESAEAPGVKLVEPGSPERSYLMEKINAAFPQEGTSMRPGDPMSISNRAAIRDWILQLVPSGKVEFVSANYASQEATGTVQTVITVRRAGGVNGQVGATVASVDGSATATGDYDTVLTTLVWTNGDRADKSFVIPVHADALAEGPETVGLQLSDPTGGASLGLPAGATLMILDRPFDDWRFQYFGASANTVAAQALSDFEEDGNANLFEYGAGTDPTETNSASGLVGGLATDRRLQLSFTRNLEAAGIIYRVQASDAVELSTWTNVASRSESGSWTTEPGVTVLDDSSSGDVTVSDSDAGHLKSPRYMRLRIDQ